MVPQVLQLVLESYRNEELDLDQAFDCRTIKAHRSHRTTSTTRRDQNRAYKV